MLSCSRGRQYQPRLLCSFASAEFNLANFSVGCVLNRWSPAAKEIRSPLRTRSRPVVPGRARWQHSFLENDTKSGENHASSRRVPSTQLPRKAWTLSGTYQLVELAPWLSLSEYVNRGIDLLPAI